MYDGLIDLKSALRTKLEKVLLSKYVDLSDDGSPASLKAKQAKICRLSAYQWEMENT